MEPCSLAAIRITRLFQKLRGGVKTLYAGGQYGYGDGSLAGAQFSIISGMARNAVTGEMYVADNNAIRLITNDQVTRITGWKGGSNPVAGNDLTGALNHETTFNSINGICTLMNKGKYLCQ